MHRPRRQLWRAYAIGIASVVTLAVLASGLAQLWLLQRATRITAETQQALEATKASARIDQFIGEIEALMRSSLALLDSGHLNGDTDVQIEFYRLLKQSRAIEDLKWIDRNGQQRVRVGRMTLDEIGQLADFSRAPAFTHALAERPWFSEVSFAGNQPRVLMSLRGARPRSGVIAARVDLTQLRDIIGDIRFGREGHAYVIDTEGTLLAHPDFHLVLAKANWAERPQVKTAIARVTAPRSGDRNGGSEGDGNPGGQSADDPIDDHADGRTLIEFDSPAGRPMIARAAALSIPNWLLITEQPRDEAYAPIRRALAIALVILLLATLFGSLVGIALARRVVRPIQQLADGARRIGDGQLDHRIALRRDDELGLLASQFNQMTEHLRDSHALLETRIATRTQELVEANAMLSIKREEAEQANLAKTRFLASASHDLRQPLHTISLLVGVLRRQTFPPEAERLIGNIEVSAAAMEALFASLLDISKLDAGMAKPALGDCALSELLRLVALNYAPEAARKRLRLVVVPSRAVVRTDAALLERVVNNLVSNAIRYTERGRILVGCRRRPDGIELQVWDTGIGIDPAHQGRIFEEFYQIDNPERDRSKGLGLGLSIVKRTLDLLGHPHTLRSTPGHGTCFSILLPAVDAPVVQPPFNAAAGGHRIAGAFIAVIDDEADTRQAMQALCHSWGAHALTAASAEECLARLDEHLRNPDLILCDYRLQQRRDGLAAVEQLRAHIGQPVPAIIITGDIAAADLRRVAEAGLPLLHKPVGADRLLAAIESALQSHPSGGGEPTQMGAHLPDLAASGHEDPAGR